MRGQRNLIDGVRDFSPARENWVDKPVEDLPEKFTVHFKTGQTSYLDLKDPLAAHRARRIDRQARAGKPVYVEIDQESNVITNVRIPQVYKVEQLNPDDYGNLLVPLQPSSTVHLLLKSNQDFESMRDSLQTALASPDGFSLEHHWVWRYDMWISHVSPSAIGEIPDRFSPDDTGTGARA